MCERGGGERCGGQGGQGMEGVRRAPRRATEAKSKKMWSIIDY